MNEAVGCEQLVFRLLHSSVTAGARTHDPWIASPTPYRLATAPPLVMLNVKYPIGQLNPLVPIKINGKKTFWEVARVVRICKWKTAMIVHSLMTNYFAMARQFSLSGQKCRRLAQGPGGVCHCILSSDVSFFKWPCSRNLWPWP